MRPRRPRIPARRLARWLASLLLLLVVAAASIAAALRVTPMQKVTVAGQVVKVGATAPGWKLSGPGEVDLFGQNLPTRLRFPGPIRPRLQLARITVNSELTNFVRGSTPAGAERTLGSRLADGWTRYFAWESALAGLGALALLGAVAGWRRLSARTTIKLLAAGLALTEAINVGAIIVTAHQAPDLLRQVHSLSQLVGSDPPPAVTASHGPAFAGVQAVVLGDSTAAGAGLPRPAHPSRDGRACGRSVDAYAQDLARANGWKVLNLACDSATIRNGLLGPQARGTRTLPAQLAEAGRVRNASVVIVSIGADDLDWSAMVQYCAVAPRCDDRATTAYFQQKLAAFSKDYLQLLSELATFPGHPRVLINRYYTPFDVHLTCLSRVGLTPGKLRILSSRLDALNSVLAKGAAEFGFTSVQPNFAGHQLCTQQPYVQGLESAAPFHPTIQGQLAIALADQAALTSAPAKPHPSPYRPTSGH